MRNVAYHNRPVNKHSSKERHFGPRSVGGDNVLYQATCANCGKPCEVPFLPRGNKPVYCKSCFKQFGKGEAEQRMYAATCGNCGKVCSVPFRPVQGKPVFCKDCFGKQHVSARGHGEGSDDIHQQLENIQSKLNTILRALTPTTPEPRTEYPTTGKKTSWRKTMKKRT